MVRCYVGVGSNIERDKHIASGIAALEQAFGDLIVSSIYESAPVGFVGDPFYNLVVGFDSPLAVEAVADTLREIELVHGRPADSKKFSSRQLDLDLLLYGDLIMQEGKLQLPRPDIERYAFVLEPLAEIAPNAIHPVRNISCEALWRLMPRQGMPQKRIVKAKT
jgi:2-amino-4-hydroxy-6-hydroxymethyldihydropteridine diphosphokinase